MVRTKADSSSVKAAGAKAPRKITSVPTSYATASSSDGAKGKQNTGGNPYFPRETPLWQKEITNFFKTPSVESMKSETLSNEKSSGEMSKESQGKDSFTKDASGS